MAGRAERACRETLKEVRPAHQTIWEFSWQTEGPRNSPHGTARPALPEDRPRGAKPKAPMKHRSPWMITAFVIGVMALIFNGIALFP